MNMNYRMALKHIALIAKVIGIFPVLILLSYIFCAGYDTNQLGIELIGFIAMGYLGYGHMEIRNKIEQRTKERRWLLHVLVAVGYIASLIIIILATRIMITGGRVQVLFGGISIILYMMFIRGYDQYYNRILSMEFIATITVIYYIAITLCQLTSLGMMYIVVVAAYIFINNQVKIDELLQRTKKNTPMAESIRRDNMKWVCLLMSVFLIGYPFRKILAKGLSFIGNGILVCILYIVKVIISLFPDVELAEEGSGQVDQMGFLLEGDKNSIVNIIIWILCIGTMILLIYKNHEMIIRSLREGLRRIQILFKRIYHFLFGRKKRDIIINEYYEDIIEEFSSTMPLKLKKEVKLNKKKWQKEVKRYLKEVQNEGQYREGYKLLLEGISLKGIEIKKAHTPREIMQEVQGKLELKSIINETITYEYIRYGEGIALPEEMINIKETLQALLIISKT